MVLESTTRLRESHSEIETSGKSLIFRDVNLKKGFVAVPRVILLDTKLSPQLKTLYSLLLNYAWQDGECFPGQNTLALNMGLKLLQIKRLLTQLKEAKLITTKRQGLGKPNIYYIESLARRYGQQTTDRGAGG